MTGDERQGEPAFDKPSTWTHVAGGATLALGSVGVLYSWFLVVTIGLAFGPRFGFWARLAAMVVGLAVMIALSIWLSRRPTSVARPGPWLLAIAAGWTLAGAAFWYALGSPFTRSVPIVALYAATTWWLLWVWLMFLVPWRPAARIGVLAVLLVIAGAFFGSVRGDGVDGNALPLLAWRFAPAKDDWSARRGPGGASGFVELAESEDEITRDYPRFRGADGLGTAHGEKLARDWSGRVFKPRWRHAVGQAWSALAVAGRRVFTQEQRGGDECVVCYARATGRQLWVHRDRARYEMPGTGDGPRATPTVDGGHVFALGATGILNCLDRRTGEGLWNVDILKDTGATAPIHGMVSSPLVLGGVVVVCAGGTNDASLVAYDRTTGRRVWAAGSDTAGYTSPLLVELAGVPQIVIVTPRNLVAHDAKSGEVLWSAPFENDTNTNCSQPCPVGENRLFASANYGTGCTLLEASQGDGGAWNARQLWSNRTMQTKFASAVIRGGQAYGLDNGILECISLADGRRRWKQGRYGHGQLLLADDLLVISAEDGRVALVAANPEEFLELGSFEALQGRTWNYPALAGGELFVRNDREAACYELPREGD
ncbi:MAG: PQQ-binding-like beta-propeller repeat protein [Pirellulales bacterium]